MFPLSYYMVHWWWSYIWLIFFREIWIPTLGSLCNFSVNIFVVEDPPRFDKDLTFFNDSQLQWNMDLISKLWVKKIVSWILALPLRGTEQIFLVGKICWQVIKCDLRSIYNQSHKDLSNGSFPSLQTFMALQKWNSLLGKLLGVVILHCPRWVSIASISSMCLL